MEVNIEELVKIPPDVTIDNIEAKDFERLREAYPGFVPLRSRALDDKRFETLPNDHLGKKPGLGQSKLLELGQWM